MTAWEERVEEEEGVAAQNRRTEKINGPLTPVSADNTNFIFILIVFMDNCEQAGKSLYNHT